MVCDSWDTQYCHDILRKEDIFYFQETKIFYSFQKDWQIEVIRIGDSWYNNSLCVGFSGRFVGMDYGSRNNAGTRIWNKKKFWGENLKNGVIWLTSIIPI